MLVSPATPDAPVTAPGAGPRIARHSHRWRVAAIPLATCAAMALALSACSSSAKPAQASASAKTCQQVGAVLSDGPDPSADPVGYAEAQILPLRQLHAADTELRAAISQLASAYAKFFASDGKSTAATSAVVAATTHMNKLCPGAGAGA
jgi:hypothetical protein